MASIKVKNSDEIARLAIDHCHKTEKIRALLCHDCNTTLGKIKDDPMLLRKAAEYLEFHTDAKIRSND